MKLLIGAASAATALLALASVQPAAASSFFFSTGDTDGRMAVATRPDSTGKFEIEAADDFVLTTGASITSATFTGLMPTGASVSNVVVEIYRVFPLDSNTGRTSGPPTFSTNNVPTRVNSPSDVALDSRDLAGGTLNVSTTTLQSSFQAANSIQPGGIHPQPGETTGGDGAVTGQEVEFDVTFTNPFSLPADHYFFVPQVELAGTDEFLWLSAPKPIVPPGTSFPTGFTDLQSWTRDGSANGIEPDWLRVGADIVGGTPAPTFNQAFSLTGTIPEPATLSLLGSGLLGLLFLRRTRSPR